MMRCIPERFRSRLKWLDSAALCYFFIAGFMIGVGLTITILTAKDAMPSGDGEQTKKEKDAMVWVVGPVFIGAGLVVLAKAATHIYRKLHPRPLTEQDLIIGPDGRLVSA